jgi:hypothetical protein
MDLEALLIINSFAFVAGAVLLAIALPLSRRFLRPGPKAHIRVTRLGFYFGMVQFLVSLSVIGWGFFRPQTLLGHVIAHPAGAPAIFILGGIVFYLVCVALQRAGVVLFYRVASGG